ncbi:GT4 family glycosyltransferase PelF [uncultured Amnibacterium sp.]|uniref:GT4 family glycosyltransferase PelF n=1 Tax=uncultured Amnibacterium sp. TaxID=1631851 RepID=UPI0035CC810E
MSYGLRGKHRAPRIPRRQRPPAAYPQVDLAIVCESTYPYLTGGLSAVVHQICEANPNRRIGIIHIAWDRSTPMEPLYDVPPQVKWVMPLYQSMSEHRSTFLSLQPRHDRLGRRARARVVERLFEALEAHVRGDDRHLWALYDEGINPRTRVYRLWPVISSPMFMIRAREYFAASGLSFTSLFWELREFFSLAFAVVDVNFPKAAVYHAHTTGAAGLLAAAAARQNDTTFLLTEHNLYARDTINHLLERSMDTVVTQGEWRTLTEYDTSAFVPERVQVTPRQRAWMAWWIHTGLVAYRAASLITYLYPDAIEEARGLGGASHKSVVVANGVQPSMFDEARAEFDARQARERSDEARIWRLAYAARVVPIKGLLDLLEALALLVRRGVSDWELDVMGPDGEMPDYAAACRMRTTELGLDGHVKFLGSVNLRQRMGLYDALILPSHNEGQPIVVLEAMTVGLPTIGTYVGGMKQLVEDPIPVQSADGADVIGACGALVRSHDVIGMAGAIERLMTDPEAFRSYSANAKDRVDRYFHLDTAMANYRALYRRFGSVPEDELLEEWPIMPRRSVPVTESVDVERVEVDVESERSEHAARRAA